MTDTLFNEFIVKLQRGWCSLADKPEETPHRTLHALWLLAAGEPRAAERCENVPLPDLTGETIERLRHLLDQRLAGVPLAHLTGRQSFMDVEMLAGPEALIPRKETELLGYAALDLLQQAVAVRGEATVIDICTGCGNLALALAHHEPLSTVFAADLAADAVALARRNAAYLGLTERVVFSVGDLFAPYEDGDFDEAVDLVVCNPPYISTQHIAEMPEEIQAHEPHLAFDGGPFGVAILFRLIKEAPRFLKPEGWLCFEVGLGQGDLMTRRLTRARTYSDVKTVSDDSGAVRAILARRI
jgi:release factor glutamine methyltransferase